MRKIVVSIIKMKKEQMNKKTLFFAMTCILIFLVVFFYKDKISIYYHNQFNSRPISLVNNDYEIVIARYKEDLSWIKDYFPTQKVTVYNKGENNLNLGENVTVVAIDNVGREAQTYLNHIVKNYSSLKSHIVFLQGNPFDHKGKIFLENIKNNKLKYSYYSKSVIGSNENVYNLAKIFNESNTNLSANSLKNTPWKNTILSSNYQDIDGFLKYHDISTEDTSKKIIVSYGAQFLTSKDKILSRPIEFYKKLLDPLSSSVAPIEGHYLERTWDLVFDG